MGIRLKFYSSTLFIVGFFASQSLLIARDINPWNLKITERIWNRKNISHLVIDTSKEDYRLVLLVADRFPYNYKQTSSSYYFVLRNEKEALELSKRISDYLETGENITVKLNGSEIKGVIFHAPYLEIP